LYHSKSASFVFTNDRVPRARSLHDPLVVWPCLRTRGVTLRVAEHLNASQRCVESSNAMLNHDDTTCDWAHEGIEWDMTDGL
jgi:hypothetical protein